MVSPERSATVINVGHSKLGGPTAALHAAQIAQANGIGVMVGSVIEMGIANAMGLHIAVPEGAGLGITVDENALHRLGARR